jgi:SAM-dependent methyltransferase
VRDGGGGDASEISVLDVGCGRPTFLRDLVKKTGWRGTGLDTADAGWFHDPPDTWSGLHLSTGTLGDAQLPADTFHLVTMWHVLEHLSNPREALSQALEITRAGGSIIVEVPDYGSIPRKVQGNSWIGFDSPRHTVVFDPTTLARTLEESGWAVQTVQQHGSMDPWLLWWLGVQVGKGESLSGRLEGAVLPFLFGKVLTWPLAALPRWFPLGAMTAVARKAGG